MTSRDWLWTAVLLKLLLTGYIEKEAVLPLHLLQSLPLLVNWTKSTADSVVNGQVYKHGQHYCKWTLRMNWTWLVKKSLFPLPFGFTLQFWIICLLILSNMQSTRPVNRLSEIEYHINASVPLHMVCMDAPFINVWVYLKSMLMQDQSWAWHDYKNHCHRPSWCSITFIINNRLSLWFSTGCPIYIISICIQIIFRFSYIPWGSVDSLWIEKSLQYELA
jgi:hypothetical protein